ncbi:MAG: DNA recombination protein RmuC, partial [Cyanobacteria bacterium J06642_12]
HENRNAEDIAAIAGKIYDQAALVDDAMFAVRKKLDQATDEFETMVKRISTGRGNLFRRVDRLRKLGARTTKTLSDEVLENSRG